MRLFFSSLDSQEGILYKCHIYLPTVFHKDRGERSAREAKGQPSARPSDWQGGEKAGTVAAAGQAQAQALARRTYTEALLPRGTRLALAPAPDG